MSVFCPLVALVLMQEEVDRPFLEPFLRSLILGLGSAVLLETAHVALQVGPARLPTPAGRFPAQMGQCPPAATC